MTYSKKWTEAKILQFCEDNFIGEDDEPKNFVAFMKGRKGSMDFKDNKVHIVLEELYD